MGGEDYIFIGIFALFLLNKSTLVTASVLLLCYVQYYVVHSNFSGAIFYVLVGTGEFLAGSAILLLYVRMGTVRAVGYLFYAAMLFNFVGWALYENYFPPTIYNNLGVFVMVSQALAMIWRLLLDAGIPRYIYHSWLLRRISVAINKRGKTHKKEVTRKEVKKCQAK